MNDTTHQEIQRAGPDASDDASRSARASTDPGEDTQILTETNEKTFERRQREVSREWEKFLTTSGHRSLLKGVSRLYSTAETGGFFDRTDRWVYWGIRKNVFVYSDGETIEPERIGQSGRRRFSLPIIREMALACYRRGMLSEDELEEVFVRTVLAQSGQYTPKPYVASAEKERHARRPDNPDNLDGFDEFDDPEERD